MTNDKTYVWLAEEYHGYNFIFSTWDNAFAWLEKERQSVYEDDLDKLENDVEYGIHASIYLEGDLVGRIERQVLDEYF
jgi:hypothetical protein